MIANGYDVAVLEHHVSSSGGGFPNPSSLGRVSYYGISGIPESIFDGVLSVLGGSSSTYNAFVTKYNQRIAIPSNFSIMINGYNQGLDYTVVLTIENVEPYSGSNLVAHLALSESGLAYGGKTYNFVTREFYPNVQGTPLDFSSNPVQTVTLNFTMNSAYVLDNCEFVAFVQDNDTKEILQATKVAVQDLLPLTTYNAAAVSMDMIPVVNCEGTVSPLVTISNQGIETLTSLDITCEVNGQFSNTYNWTGNLPFQELEEVQLPPLAFDVLGDNELVVYVSNPNGNDDEDPANDTLSTTFAGAPEVYPNVYLYLKLDENPDEITWDCTDASGQVLFSGGPYSSPNAFIKDTLFLTDPGCYTFTINDAGGDGLQSPGFYRLTGGSGTEIIFNNNFTASKEIVQFGLMISDVDENNYEDNFSIYPNPFTDNTTVGFVLNDYENVELNVYDPAGKVVISKKSGVLKPGGHSIKIDGEDLNPGIYFVGLKIGDKLLTEKISIIK